MDVKQRRNCLIISSLLFLVVSTMKQFNTTSNKRQWAVGSPEHGPGTRMAQGTADIDKTEVYGVAAI